MDSREPQVHLPTGTPRSSTLHQLSGDPGPMKPPGTTTLRDQHSHRQRMSRAPEPHLYRRLEHTNGFSDVAVRADSKGTSEGSTVAIVVLYAALRVFSTATPAIRLLFNPCSHAGLVMNSITPGNSSTAKLAYETHLADRPEETAHDTTTRRTSTEARTSPATTVGDLIANYIHSSGQRAHLLRSPSAP